MLRRAESAYLSHRDTTTLYDSHNFETHPYTGNYYPNTARPSLLSVMTNNSTNLSPRINTSRINKQYINNLPEKLIIEQVHKPKAAENKYTSNDSTLALNPLNYTRKSVNLNNEVKGMTIGKMMMMSNGERTKLVENRIQDRHEIYI